MSQCPALCLSLNHWMKGHPAPVTSLTRVHRKSQRGGCPLGKDGLWEQRGGACLSALEWAVGFWE